MSTPLVPGSSPWWLARLALALATRQARIQQYGDYYEGLQPVSFASLKFRNAFATMFMRYADNLCLVVVDAVEDRLNVEGFRLGGEGSPATDGDAWRIWQENQLDAWSQIAHTTALVKEEAYAIVGPGTDTTPLITIEDPTETIVEMSSARRGVRLAGFKRWIDDDGSLCATLYMPDRIEKYRARDQQDSTLQLSPFSTGNEVAWDPRRVKGEAWPLPNPLGVVPIVPLTNRPRLTGGGRSEIADIIPIQNAVNKLGMDMLIAAEYAAFPRMWATGIDIPRDPETKEPIEDWRATVNRFFSTTSENAKFGTLESAELSQYAKAIEMYVQHIATISRTPMHYLLGQAGSFPSGESLKATETGLVAKVRRKQRYFGEGWEEVIRLAFGVLEDPRSKVTDSETIWRDPESRTESAHVDALVKLASIGVPEEQLWEDAGYTPQQVERFKAIRALSPKPDIKEVPISGPAAQSGPLPEEVA
ncbi:MAG: phage portal protein [Candidatus Limnocylindrales bacterium]